MSSTPLSLRLFFRTPFVAFALFAASCSSNNPPSPSTPATAEPSASTTPAPAIAAPINAARQTVILISIDGMRYDYLTRYQPPVLTALAQRGVRAERLISCFPSLTFPNHYSIVTGLYPEHHGIIANSMFAPEWGAYFSMSSPLAKEARWWGGEPIWNTVKRQNLVAACNFWPGSEAPINNRRPTYWLPFSDNQPHGPRVEKTLSWLDVPAEKRPALITLYFSDVDHAGHSYGPVTPQVQEALLGIDAAIGQLVEGLRARNLLDTVNIIVVSDHGMASTSSERTLYIDDFLPGKTLDGIAQVDFAGAIAGLRPLGNTSPEQLRDFFRDKNPHLTAYLKQDLPERFHYKNNSRIPPVILLPAGEWLLAQRPKEGSRPHRSLLGNHGYDPENDDMGATFIAAGPAFKTGYTFSRAMNIDIYDMICAILRIQPAPNDGTDALAKEILKERAQ